MHLLIAVLYVRLDPRVRYHLSITPVGYPNSSQGELG
jgi:hypothetical protein